ncbi:hypothetical protein [Pseudarthrobacter sp. lyk4-40-TYG-27]|uniref:hypothetical protein n=1 Tax=Pseudarthrobacter sp. lyk4-40-TYG-27 TaxID=3040305 RepID=UPI002552B2A5|nr:hypothetical protein [Pseudarthrobacter sp. lyk4-40-TYG-27]
MRLGERLQKGRVLTPAAGAATSYQQTYEAENATVVNAKRYTSTSASNGAYVGGTGDARSDSFVDFIVNVPTTAKYSLRV